MMRKLLSIFILLSLCICAPHIASAQYVIPGGGGLPGIPGGPTGPGFPGIPGLPGFPGGDGDNKGGGTIIVIPEDPTPGGINGGRSVTIDTVSAWADVDFAQMIIYFNVSIGRASAVIYDVMGRAVSGYTCDTSMESEIWIPLPTTPGIYTLRINGAEFVGNGYFEL